MKAYELIDSPDKWCQHEAVIRDKNNNCRYCALGCMGAAYLETDDETYVEMKEILLDHITSNTSFTLVSEWNDNSDWETVYSTLKQLNI